jgi:hypothetical protein
MTFLSDIYTLESATIWKLGRNFLSFRNASSRDFEKILPPAPMICWRIKHLSGEWSSQAKSSDAEKSRFAGLKLYRKLSRFYARPMEFILCACASFDIVKSEMQNSREETNLTYIIETEQR